MKLFNRRAMRPLLFAILVVLSSSLEGQIAEGDRLYARRAVGATGSHARAEHIEGAIVAFQRAVNANPEDLEAHWKLLRAHRYKGAYVARSSEEKKAAYGTAKLAGDKAIAAAGKQLAARGVNPAKAKEAEIASAGRGMKHLAEVYVWDAINWGEWALAYGKLAAVRQGAADRIRRHATIAMLVDPRVEGGAPAQVLGRLHDQTPRVPFITGWASSKEAVQFLQASLEIDPANKLTTVFLAEALVSRDARTKPRAIEMLRRVIGMPPDPEYVVEDTATIEDAKELLRKWSG